MTASAQVFFAQVWDAQEYIAKQKGGKPEDYFYKKAETQAAVDELGIRKAFDDAVARMIPESMILSGRQKTADQPALDQTVQLIQASELSIHPIDWLWPGYLARGKLHVIAGAPGTGKTTITIALMATVTSGGRWPDGSRASPANVMMWSGEDDPQDTLIPRFVAMGGDRTKLFFVGNVIGEGKPRPFDPARDMDALIYEASRVGDIAMLGVDPIVNVVTGDSHKNTETRRALQPVVDLAAQLRVAVIGVSHFSKGTAGRDPVERVTGSVAFGALPRVIFGAAKRTEEQGGGRVFVRAKSNIGPDGGGFTYDLEQAEVPQHKGIIASQLRWGSALDGSARDLLAEAEVDPSEVTGTDQAEAFLLEMLAHGRVLARDVKRSADGEGISEKSLRRARERLNVAIKREGFGNKMASYWELPVMPSSCIQAHSCPPEKGAGTGTNAADTGAGAPSAGGKGA